MKGLKRSHGWMLLGLLALTLGLLACQRPATPNKIVFRYWGDIEEAKIIDVLVKDFKVSHPNIEVMNQRVAAGGGPYDDKLSIMFAAKSAPDVFLVSSYYSDK